MLVKNEQTCPKSSNTHLLGQEVGTSNIAYRRPMKTEERQLPLIGNPLPKEHKLENLQ